VPEEVVTFSLVRDFGAPSGYLKSLPGAELHSSRSAANIEAVKMYQALGQAGTRGLGRVETTKTFQTGFIKALEEALEEVPSPEAFTTPVKSTPSVLGGLLTLFGAVFAVALLLGLSSYQPRLWSPKEVVQITRPLLGGLQHYLSRALPLALTAVLVSLALYFQDPRWMLAFGICLCPWLSHRIPGCFNV
jgi:hypothetical protein